MEVTNSETRKKEETFIINREAERTTTRKN